MQGGTLCTMYSANTLVGTLFLKPDFVWEEWRFDDKGDPSYAAGLAVPRAGGKRGQNFQQNRNNRNRKTYNIQYMIHDKGIET